MKEILKTILLGWSSIFIGTGILFWILGIPALSVYFALTHTSLYPLLLNLGPLTHFAYHIGDTL